MLPIPNTTATFAPDSSTNPDISLYFSTLNLGVSGGSWGPRPIGTVNLTNYTGPLSIGTLNVGDLTASYNNTGGVGHFIFGNPVNNTLRVPTVLLTQGDMQVNAGAVAEIIDYLSIGSSGQLICHVSAQSSGLLLDNASASALSLGSGQDRIVLSFDSATLAGGPYYGLRWRGDHAATLQADLEAFGGNGSIDVHFGTSGLSTADLTVGMMNVNGIDYTYVELPYPNPPRFPFWPWAAWGCFDGAQDRSCGGGSRPNRKIGTAPFLCSYL